MNIVTCLNKNIEYKEHLVHSLYNQLCETSKNFEFFCVSNSQNVPGYIPTKNNWPKWWCKIESFQFSGPTLYLDLDTIILKDLNNIFDIITNTEFIALRDFYNPEKTSRIIGSGVMGWNSDMSYLYDIFRKEPDKHISENNSSRWWGDQGFIERHVKLYDLWQDNTDEIVSWKKHCTKNIPENASIIAFHGKPRPWEVDRFKYLYE